MSAETKNILDKALRDHMNDEWEEDASLLTHWIVIAAGVDADGEPRIMSETLDELMPAWQVRGLLGEALINLDVDEDL